MVPIKCKVDGCDRSSRCPVGFKGYCRTHFRRFQKTGDPGSVNIRAKFAPGETAKCSVNDCHNYSSSKEIELCKAHYQRLKRNGTIGTAKIALHERRTGEKCAIKECDRIADGQKGLCSSHSARLMRTGNTGSGFIKRRKRILSSGYYRKSVEGESVAIHLILAEKALGRPLPKGVEIHHFDGDSLNNDPSNLVICPDKGYHKLLHVRTTAFEVCGHADWLKCWVCQRYDAPENLYIRKGKRGGHHYHRQCLYLYNVGADRKMLERMKNRLANRRRS